MVAYEIPGQYITLVANEEIATGKHKYVIVNSSGTMSLAGAAATNAVGILQEDALPEGAAGRVMINGVSFVKLGATVAPGSLVEIAAGGVAITATSGTVVGICLVGGDADEYGCVLIK
jgi:hypothetical protein